jgi:hypothetical protein
MKHIASRLAAVRPSASMAASLAAKALMAEGVDVVDPIPVGGGPRFHRPWSRLRSLAFRAHLHCYFGACPDRRGQPNRRSCGAAATTQRRMKNTREGTQP